MTILIGNRFLTIRCRRDGSSRQGLEVVNCRRNSRTGTEFMHCGL